jgi:hypothetical protein
MELFKDFYKRKQPNKFFYAKTVKVRSRAYGEDVKQDFLDWQAYIMEKCKKLGDKFNLCEMDGLYGQPPQADTQLDKSLVPLLLEGYRFELLPDGYISVNGKRSVLRVGKEIKAGALFHIPEERETFNGLAVIGKPTGTEEMRLSVYFMQKGDFDKTPFDSVPLAPTLDASSHLFCLGRHIFLIHNSQLDYYFLNFEERRLERVAIGQDDNNEQFPWCQFVSPCFVTNGKGDVFWIANQEVYTFSIGSPGKLIKIDCNKIEEPVHLVGTDEGVLVYKKQRGTATMICAPYKKARSGRYLAQLNNDADEE